MNTPIKTNRLKVKINHSEYEKHFDVFLISTSEKYICRGAYIIDAPILCNDVLSVCFESGREFYVLMRKSDANKVLLKKVITESEGGETLTVADRKSTRLNSSHM